MSHTETPWQTNGPRVEPVNAPRYELNDGWVITDCQGPDGTANAAYIVRAVNSHAALVQALQTVLDWMPCGISIRKDERVIIDCVKAALTLAKEEP